MNGIYKKNLFGKFLEQKSEREGVKSIKNKFIEMLAKALISCLHMANITFHT